MVADRRRKKKARVQAESSSEDESSGNESNQPSSNELSELSESDNDDEPETSDHHEPQAEDEAPRELLHKMPHNSDLEFNQIFLKMVTEQFGDDLAALRQSNDFTPASISQLVAGLKQGVDIFSPEQQRILMEKYD